MINMGSIHTDVASMVNMCIIHINVTFMINMGSIQCSVVSTDCTSTINTAEQAIA